MSHLFDEVKIGDVVFRNRIGVSPMCMYSYKNGFTDDWQLVHLGERAIGGAGLIIAEATAIHPAGRITPHDAGIWLDDHIEPMARMTHFVKSNGAVAGIQLAHAGRKACVNRPWDGAAPILKGENKWWQAVGASPIAYNDNYQVPRELTVKEIFDVQNDFVSAARRSLDAGFNLIEIHAAHGYLLHSFYSPRSNQRTDEYGGNFDNRIRFLKEVSQKVRNIVPEAIPLFVRISGTEWVEDGWNLEESIALAKILKKEGVDCIDCSSGGNIAGAGGSGEPGFQVFIADEIRRAAEIKTATVGQISEAQHAEQIVREEKADFVLLGREFLKNPYWPIQAAIKLGANPPIPPQYLRAY
jgi:2,4-dienoyl-CoA reductase-like NADH-dependent reductase (Old Yellow Enzyme family)